MLGITNQTQLAKILLMRFGTAWDRMWTDYTADYNPIWNVDGTETITETRDLSHATTAGETNSHTTKGDDTETRNLANHTSGSGSDTEFGTDRTTHTGTQTGTSSDSLQHGEKIDHNEYAIGSTGASPVSNDIHSGTDSQSGSTSNEQNLTDDTSYGHGHSTSNSQDGTDTGTVKHENGTTENGSVDRTENGSETGTVTTEHKRGGNIGVTMTQQMLEADLAYWSKIEAQFFGKVLKDIVDEITYKIYTNDERTDVRVDGGGDDSKELVKRITPLLSDGVAIATFEQEDGNE